MLGRHAKKGERTKKKKTYTAMFLASTVTLFQIMIAGRARSAIICLTEMSGFMAMITLALSTSRKALGSSTTVKPASPNYSPKAFPINNKPHLPRCNPSSTPPGYP